ncbi:leukocyte elastase inhibitor-like [Bacillus rossius redtenbacheri]|uniref:leukocyte elastase inhibitor-like n=1 Tax=Bacillus rossius redtenbacheri TaxID=93214 RepID=UPI002FDE8BEA
MKTAFTVLLGACTLQFAAALLPLRKSSFLKDAMDNRFNFFDVELLREVCDAETGNVVVSPASVKAVLAMVLEGAQGDSAEQIRTALRLPASQQEIRSHLQKYLASLQSAGNSYTLEMANRLFLSRDLNLKPEYAVALRSYYHADVQQVDFEQPKVTADTINEWVKIVTHQLIPTIVEAENFKKDAVMLLANAIFFKGRWRTEFDLDGTLVRCFYPKPSTCQKSYMMESVDYYRYGNVEDLDAQAVDIPYQASKFSMLVVMPNKLDGIGQLVRDLPHRSISAILQSLELTEVVISLPRFQLDYSTDLVKILRQLDIKDIFGANANLTAMVKETENAPYISNVFHKAKIIVNEEGSIAAAGTGALVIPLMGSTVPRLRVDRPFLFFIRDTVRGSVIFAGRVTTPEEAKPDAAPPRNSDPAPGSALDALYKPQMASAAIAPPTMPGRPQPPVVVRPQAQAPGRPPVYDARIPPQIATAQSYPNLRDKVLGMDASGSPVNVNKAPGPQNQYGQSSSSYEDSITFSDKQV